MGEEGRGAARWLRPLGLFGVTLALSVGHPLLLVAIPLGLLTFALPGHRLLPFLMGAVLLGVSFGGGAEAGGLWFLERGWIILVGGGFVALSMMWPERGFLERGLPALAGGFIACAVVLFLTQGWPAAEWLVEERIRAAGAVTMEFMTALGGEGERSPLTEAVARTVEMQVYLFPALLALATLAGMGVAWWLHTRVGHGSDRGLGSLRGFRFPDPLIWVLIGGLVLGLMGGWTGDAGRVGANLMIFMGALFALRGAGVLLFLSGGLTLGWALLLVVGMVVAAPVLLLGAMALGMSDSWLDLRARAAGSRNGDPDTIKE